MLPAVHQPSSSAPKQNVITPVVHNPQRAISKLVQSSSTQIIAPRLAIKEYASRFQFADIVKKKDREILVKKKDREILFAQARLEMMETETLVDRRQRERWEAVVCAIESLDIGSWIRKFSAIKAINSPGWHEWSNIRAAAARGSTESEDVKRLVAGNSQYIRDAYATLEEERRNLGEYPLSLIFGHPYITVGFMSSVCSRMEIAGEARRVILLTKKSDGDPVFRNVGGIVEL
ncbi:hypothetical protein B0H19DRAFT_1237711 [Mycena capillaripes]|nr:hypothetical protein B0H19DRAFT_1237711 [Mycena capillaripes]